MATALEALRQLGDLSSAAQRRHLVEVMQYSADAADAAIARYQAFVACVAAGEPTPLLPDCAVVDA